ncbi:aminotransferase class V-fold PLP-dependent enzyme [Bremerella sp. JC817]|uniref:DegT/DnrJ/EryC1/StrS family aminotransferase n=1 Tax=Bremerella sp. JC817 TaxID=3231756 RepID=UPI00345A17B1
MEPAWNPEWNVWPTNNNEAIRDAILSAYEDGSWGHYHGPNVEKLEATLATFHQVDHALTCASGTIAVQIALQGLNLPAGSEVLLAAYDFPGNFRAIQDVGLFPVLVDIDPKTWCIDPGQIEEAISEKSSAIIVSHLHGGIADMKQIGEIADRHGLAIVEDACQATGGRLDGKRLGSLGDVGVLSFGGSKLITAGRGGAILSNRADLMQRAKVFCERGNHAFPLSELQAAVLLPQWQTLDAANQTRLANIERLRAALHRFNNLLEPVAWNALGEPAFYKHAWICESTETARWLFTNAQRDGVPLAEGFRGFTKRPPSQARKVGQLTYAKDASERTVILHHPVLLRDETVVDRLAGWISEKLDSQFPRP